MLKMERPTRIPNELQARLILERVVGVEKHFAELCSAFAAYSRKNARLRDKGDDLSKCILTFGESEILNKSLRSCLMRFSNSISAIGDLRDAFVNRIEKKVISELSSYGNACQLAKEDVKEAIAATEREQMRKKQFERIRERNPRNRQQISKAESEYQRANADAVRTARILEERALTFEERKLIDVKNILLHFTKAEVAYHCRALEIFTQAYQEIASIEINEDFEEFRSALQTPGDSYPPRLEVVKRSVLRVNPSSSSAPSLLSLGGLFSTPSSSSKSIFKRETLQEESVRNTRAKSLETVEIEDYKDEDEEDKDDDEDDEDNSQSLDSEEIDERNTKFR